MGTSTIKYICPTCKKEVIVHRSDELPWRPFCCQRCKLVDLYKWFNEEYRISEPMGGDAEWPEGNDPPR